MSLDISFTRRKKITCPHCGTLVTTRDEDTINSGGGSWYPFLESIGYYVPYEQRTEENDWYGKDMVLTKEQAEYLYRFARDEEIYNVRSIAGMVAVALFEKDDIVVNADW